MAAVLPQQLILPLVATFGAAPVPLRDPMDEALEWISFTSPAHRVSIVAEGFNTFVKLSSNTTRDIADLSSSFVKRTVAYYRIKFGICRTRRIKAMLYWDLDFQRCSKIPTIAGMYQGSYLILFENAINREDICTQESDQAAIISKQDEPGKFKDERKWYGWYAALANYVSTVPGASGVTLSYVIRKQADATPTGHNNFFGKCIACAHMTFPIFKSDTRRVHQVINSNAQGEDAEQWIDPHKIKQNGRVYMVTLRAH